MGSKNIFLRKWYFTITSLLCCAELFAKPHGMRAKHGHAKITNDTGSELHIEAGDKAILEWESFSIGKSEKTVFVQPGKHSVVLNRVVTKNPSDILGTLEANGRVYLINPNGILVGKDAYINVSGFLASTLDILDENAFLKGDTFAFEGRSTNAVVNRGNIKAIEGDVFLIGRYVKNEGSIEAQNGVVGLAVGREVLLQLKDGDRRIYIRPKEEKEALEGIGAENSGTINASQAILDAEGSLYNLAIRDIKPNDASTFTIKAGRIYLSAEGGKAQLGGVLVAKNTDGSGGEIKTVASEVETTRQSKFDVSGVNGDAGKIYLHGKNLLSVSGTMKAAGGDQKGNGGIIELETQGILDFKANNVDMKAPFGEVGNLIFRAPDIRISSEKSSSISILTTAFVQKALLHSNISIYSGKNISLIEGIDWDSSKTAQSATTLFLKASEAIYLGREKSTRPTYLISSNLHAAGKTVFSLEAPKVFIGNQESGNLSSLNPKSGDIRVVTSFLGVYGGVGDTQKSDTSAKIFANDGNIFIDTFKDSALHIELKAGSGPISPVEIATNKGNIWINTLGNAAEGSLAVLAGSGDNSGARIATIYGGNVESWLPSNSNYLIQGGNSSNIGSAQIVAAVEDGSKGSVKLYGKNYTLAAGTGSGDVRARISGDVASKSKDAVFIKMNGTLAMESGMNQAKDSRVMIQALGGGDLHLETEDQGRINLQIKGGGGDNSAAIIETKNGGNIHVNEENKAKEGNIHFEAGSGKQSSVRVFANDGGDIALNMPLTTSYALKGGNEVFKDGETITPIDSSVLISTQKGQIFLQGKELLLAGGAVGGGNAAKVINDNGGITLKFTNTLKLESGSHKGSDAVIRSYGPLEIYASGDILLQASEEGMALLQSFGAGNIIAGNSIGLNGDNGGKACIQNAAGKNPGKGKLHIEAGRDVNLQGSSIIQNLADEIVIVSGENTIVGSKSVIKSGEGITFIVDKQSYTSGLYKFGLTVEPGADVDGPIGKVHLFTSKRSLNSIPLYMRTFEKHGSHYPNEYKGEENYVLHYRIVDDSESERVVIWNLVNVLNSQLFYNLYNQYDDIYHRKIEFSIADQLFSPWKDLYGIKRKSRFQFTYGLPGDK